MTIYTEEKIAQFLYSRNGLYADRGALDGHILAKLHRMELKGLVRSEHTDSIEPGYKCKVYRLTDEGKIHFTKYA